MTQYKSFQKQLAELTSKEQCTYGVKPLQGEAATVKADVGLGLLVLKYRKSFTSPLLPTRQR